MQQISKQLFKNSKNLYKSNLICKNINKYVSFYKFSSQKPHSTAHTIKQGDLSNDMLISLSMGHLKSTNKNQKELSENLQQNNIIKHPLAIHAFEKLDRKYFDLNKKNKNKLYKNEIIRMQFGQNMTTPLMHGIVLEVLAESIEKLSKRYGSGNFQKENLQFLDIGSGRGYICFAIQLMLQELNMKGDIKGIDIFDTLLEDSEKIKENLIKQNIINESSKFKFENYSLQDYTNIMANQKSCYKQSVHLIHSGIALLPEQSQQLISKVLNQNYSEFIYPQIQEDREQTLYRGITNSTNYESQDIMKCMYTIAQNQQQIEISQKQEKSAMQENPQLNQQDDEFSDDEKKEEEEKLQQKMSIQEGIEKLQKQIKEKEQFIKVWTLQYKKDNGEMPKLKQMMQNSEMESNLKTLNVIKRQLSILKRSQEDLENQK